MGSEFGYKYDYTFSMMKADEIHPKYKSIEKSEKKTFMFDIRTNFQLVRVEKPLLIIDSERFDVSVDEAYCRPDITISPLKYKINERLNDYWMTPAEILTFSNAAIDFAKQMAEKALFLCLIPVLVRFQVCTVQREGESYESAMDRAICSKKLLPLYLWDIDLTVTAADVYSNVLDKYVVRSIRMRHRSRNTIILDPDWACLFCSRRQTVDAQISRLKCHHVFHSHCLARYLEDHHDKCPICGYRIH